MRIFSLSKLVHINPKAKKIKKQISGEKNNT